MKQDNKNQGWMFVLPWGIDGIGGVNIVVVELCKAINKYSDFHPYIFILDWNVTEPEIIKKDFYTEIRFKLREPITDGVNSFKSIAAYILYLPKTLFVLRKIIKKYNISVINPHFVGLEYSAISHLKLLNMNLFKLIFSVHGSDILNANIKGFLSKIFWSTLFSPANSIVACSRGLAEQTIATFSNKDKVTYIHNGISPEFIYNLESSNEVLIGDLKNKQYILSVGTYEYKKGHDVLIKAFSEIIKTHKDLHLVLVGRMGPEFKNINLLVEKLDLLNNVSLVCDVNPIDIPVYFKYAYIYVSASRYEPFGIVILEAGVAHLPVVATSTMGANEIISDEIDGTIIPIDDVSELANALSCYLEKPENINKHGSAMFEKVNMFFSWETALKSYLKLVI